MEGQRKPPALFHPQNLRRLFRTVEVELLLVAGFFAHELFAQRRLRGYDEDFLFVVQHFGAAGARAEEVKGTFTAMFQFHQRAHGDGVAVRELARAELLKLGDGGFEFHRLLGLAAGEIGGFEAARVAFALSLALLVRGLGARGVCGAEINLQFFRESGDDFFDEGAFVHRYFSIIGFNSAMVFFGQALRSVMMAFFSAEWHGQSGSAGICGITLATMALAVAAFFIRLAMTISTVTCASST